jgi:hypothetical protein
MSRIDREVKCHPRKKLIWVFRAKFSKKLKESMALSYCEFFYIKVLSINDIVWDKK